MGLRVLEISVDLDSTIADTRHRRGVIEQFTKHDPPLPIDWTVYAQACAEDVVTPFGRLLLGLQGLIRWHVVSGRSEGAREATEAWLAKHGFFPYSVNLENGETEAHGRLGHSVWKARRVLEVAEKFPGISIHVDDWAQVADVLEAESGGRITGLTVLPPGMAISKPVDDNPPDFDVITSLVGDKVLAKVLSDGQTSPL